MASFRYLALEGSAARRGTLEAPSRASAIEQLKARGLVPLELEEDRGAERGGLISLRGFKTRDIARFARLFRVLSQAGIRPHDILEVLSKDMKNPRLRQGLAAMAQDVGAGSTLYEAALRQPFLRPYAGMVRSGEKIGDMGKVMAQLAQFLEREADLADEIKGALTYPVVVLLIGLVIIYFLFTGLVPSFAQTLSGLGGELPLLTRVLIAVGFFLKKLGFTLPLLALLAFVGLRAYYQRPEGRLRVDALLLRLPVVGELLRDRATSKGMRTLAMMLRGGIPILEALETVSKSTGNAVYDQAFGRIREEIAQRARSVPEAFRIQEGLFSAAALQQVTVGEQTGNLAEMMDHIAEDHEKESSLRARALPKLIEPFSIVFLGGVVGLTVAGMFLPLFRLIGALGR